METYFDILPIDLTAYIQLFIKYNDLNNWCRIINYCDNKTYWEYFYSLITDDWELIVDNKPEDISYVNQYKKLWAIEIYGGKTIVSYFDLTPDIIYYMISRNIIDINKKDKRSKTLLKQAVELNNIDIIKYLIKKGADINPKNGENKDFLIQEINPYNFNTIKYLIENGAKIINIQKLLNNSMNYGYLDIVDYLISLGANINYIYYPGETLLINSSELGDINKVKFLINRGADPNMVNNRGLDALQIAAEYGNFNIIKYFITEYGEKILYNIKDILNRYPAGKEFLKSYGIK